MMVRVEGVRRQRHGRQFVILSIFLHFKAQSVAFVPQTDGLEEFSILPDFGVKTGHAEVIIHLVAGDASVDVRIDHVSRQDLILQVLWQIDKDGSRPAAGGDVKGIIHHEGDFRSRLDLVTPLCAGFGHFHSRSGLEGVGGRSSGCLSTQNDHGDTVTDAVLKGCDQVGNARSRSGNDHSNGLDFTIDRIGFGIALCNMPCRRFIRVGDPSNGAFTNLLVSGIVRMELIEKGEDGSSGISIHDLHPMFKEFEVHNGSSGKSFVFFHHVFNVRLGFNLGFGFQDFA
mmetsp:Transcript_6491/g.10114  ORF Transcript_6491/g.10114 Transcript_6491/m.10114 type:complete len:285 (-) Transcript_6491:460-1314(-)